MDSKRCSRCGETKPLDKYWRSRARPDGRQHHCISCQRKYRPSGHYSELAFEWHKTIRRIRALWGNRERDGASRGRARAAVAVGLLVWEPCELCGCTPGEGHHPSYSAPYNVRWLCKKCHRLVHVGRIVLLARPPAESLQWRQYNEALEAGQSRAKRPDSQARWADVYALGNAHRCCLPADLLDPRPMREQRAHDAAETVAAFMANGMLSRQEQRVLEARFGLNGRPRQTLREIGRAWKVTAEGIRHAEGTALAKLRRRLTDPLNGQPHSGLPLHPAALSPAGNAAAVPPGRRAQGQGVGPPPPSPLATSTDTPNERTGP